MAKGCFVGGANNGIVIEEHEGANGELVEVFVGGINEGVEWVGRVAYEGDCDGVGLVEELVFV